DGLGLVGAAPHGTEEALPVERLLGRFLGRVPRPKLPLFERRRRVELLADAAPYDLAEIEVRLLPVRGLVRDHFAELLLIEVAHDGLLLFPRGRGVCEELRRGKRGREEVAPAGHRHIVVHVEHGCQRVRRAENEAGRLFTLARDGVLPGLGNGEVPVVQPALDQLVLTAEVGLVGGEQEATVAAVVLRKTTGLAAGKRRAVGDAAPQESRALAAGARITGVRLAYVSEAGHAVTARIRRELGGRVLGRGRSGAIALLDRVRELCAARPATEQLCSELSVVLEPRALGQGSESPVKPGHVLVEPPEDEVAAITGPGRTGAGFLSGGVGIPEHEVSRAGQAVQAGLADPVPIAKMLLPAELAWKLRPTAVPAEDLEKEVAGAMTRQPLAVDVECPRE